MVSLSCGLFKCIIGEFGGQPWVEQLLGPRGTGLVRTFLEGSVALVGIMASLQAFLALHVGGRALPGAATTPIRMHGVET